MTSIRASLHHYCRLPPWRVWGGGARDIGLYILFDVPHGNPGNTNWKITCLGSILHRSGNHGLPSIRLSAFRQGLMGSAYLSLLQRLAQQGGYLR